MRTVALPLSLCLLLLEISFLISCSSKTLAPLENKNFSSIKMVQVWRRGVIENPGQYRVVKGDSLFAIAWKFGIDHRKILKLNNIRNKNLIFEGQILRLPSEGSLSESVAPTNQNKVRENEGFNSSHLKQDWSWPVIGDFNKVHDGGELIGLEIYGSAGKEIKSASPGTVVYSGNGLKGYGELVIVKHSETFLSAYAHNQKRLVDEGEIVKMNQVIGLMGSTGATRDMLYFEIRRNGKSVNPLLFLPKI